MDYDFILHFSTDEYETIASTKQTSTYLDEASTPLHKARTSIDEAREALDTTNSSLDATSPSMDEIGTLKSGDELQQHSRGCSVSTTCSILSICFMLMFSYDIPLL